MTNWFECKVRYDKVQENGAVKKVTEPYLVDALSFTEAEARIIEEQTPFIAGDFSVSAVKRTKISEIFWNEGGDRWYTAKLAFVEINPQTGVEKKTSTLTLAQASNFKEALEVVVAGMKNTASDYEIQSITETPLMDVYRAKLGEFSGNAPSEKTN